MKSKHILGIVISSLFIALCIFVIVLFAYKSFGVNNQEIQHQIAKFGYYKEDLITLYDLHWTKCYVYTPHIVCSIILSLFGIFILAHNITELINERN